MAARPSRPHGIRGTAWLAALALAIGGTTRLRAAEAPSLRPAEVIEAWGMDRGLPQAAVTAIVQTRDDYLWVGTDGGLARFDGMKFTTFRMANTPAMASHAVTDLLEDKAGDLWIATERGVLRLQHGNFELVGLADRPVGVLGEGAGDVIWAGTDTGVARISGGRVENLDATGGVPTAPVQALLADSSGRVWVGLGGWAGLACVNGDHVQPVDTAGTVQNEVLSIAEEPKGTLWFGTTQGLVRLEGGNWTRFGPRNGLAGARISDLYADPAGGLWVASSGLQKMVGANLDIVDVIAPVRARVFHGLCKDREGNMWAGSTGQGLVRIRSTPCQLLGLGARNTATGFRTVMQGADGIVRAAQGAVGFADLGGAANVRRFVSGVGGEDEYGDVLAVYVSRSGDLWVGGRDALQITRRGKVELHPELAGVRAIFEDHRGRLWLGRQNAAFTVWEDGVFTKPALPPDVAMCSVSSFAETSRGDVWVGTWAHGALRVRDNEVTVFNRAKGLPADELRFVFVDPDDRVWIGSNGRGLIVQDGTRWFAPEWTSDRIDVHVISIVGDAEGNLWLATPVGVFMANRAELLDAMTGRTAPNRLRIINVAEGLPEGINDLVCFPNAWRASDGLIWFATRRGLLRVDPAQLRPNLRAPTVHIERVLVNGQRQPAGDEIVLPPDTRSLGIDYTGLSFTAPGRVRFQYRLSGFDDDWMQADDRRSASYPHLRPGAYEFRVIARNADGVWNETGAALRIVQEAHFYEHRWVQGLGALALIGTVFGFYRWRSAAHERERRRLEVAIAERTRELRAAKEVAEASTRAKADFLESISHEIRNPLNGIMGLVAMLREAPLDARERELAQSLGVCAKSLGRVFDGVLNYARLEHGAVTVRQQPFSLTAMLDDVVALFRVQARQRGSELRVRRAGDVPERWIGDAEKIESILGNFVSNALKYAPGAPVELLVECEAVDAFSAEVTFNVTDGGPGIPAEEQERIFGKFVRGSAARTQRAPGAGLGLATCRALADLLGGHVAVESPVVAPAAGARTGVAGPGTTFFLRVRLKLDRSPVPSGAPAVGPAPGAATGRALVVEDQPYNQIVVRRIAEQLGFSADVVAGPDEALAAMGRHGYAVVFVDWELPGMNGDELTRRLRAGPGGAEAIVIATTAHDSDEIRHRGDDAGMDAFVVKPFDAEAIARVLGAVRARRAAEAGAPPVVDTRVFRFIGYGDPKQAAQAAALYIDILDREVGQLETALREDDAAQLAAVAHRIKSHAGLVDAAALREAADRLQRAAQGATAADLAGLVAELVRHASALRERLRSARDPSAVG